MADVERTLYGNSREKNGGGLFGRMNRLEVDFQRWQEERRRWPAWAQLAVGGLVLSLALDIAFLLALIGGLLSRLS